MFSRIELLGFLRHDPQFITSAKGTPICRFQLGISKPVGAILHICCCGGIPSLRLTLDLNSTSDGIYQKCRACSVVFSTATVSTLKILEAATHNNSQSVRFQLWSLH